jgi:hypothetical protein
VASPSKLPGANEAWQAAGSDGSGVESTGLGGLVTVPIVGDLDALALGVGGAGPGGPVHERSESIAARQAIWPNRLIQG